MPEVNPEQVTPQEVKLEVEEPKQCQQDPEGQSKGQALGAETKQSANPELEMVAVSEKVEQPLEKEATIGVSQQNPSEPNKEEVK